MEAQNIASNFQYRCHAGEKKDAEFVFNFFQYRRCDWKVRDSRE